MSIIRTKKSARTPFVMLDTTALNDDRLSFRAKGLHSYLMSKPDGWQVHIDHLETVSQEGRHAIRMALQELANAGYLHREKVRGEHGRMAGWVTTIYETPQGASDDDAAMACSPSSPTCDFPTSVSPTSVSPTSENRTLVSIDLRSKALNEVKTPNPINGEQNALEATTRGTIAESPGEHTVCSGDDSSMVEVTHPLPKNSRAHGTNPRAVAARHEQAVRHIREARQAACTHCDTQGWLTLLDESGTSWQHKCPHDWPRILAFMERHRYHWPHAPPGAADGGPAP